LSILENRVSPIPIPIPIPMTRRCDGIAHYLKTSGLNAELRGLDRPGSGSGSGPGSIDAAA
jgi:hypothetical protein